MNIKFSSSTTGLTLLLGWAGLASLGGCGGGGGAAAPAAPAAPAPVTLAYKVQASEYQAGHPIQVNLPQVGGSRATSFAVAPPLPAGLHLDPATGAITGVPTVPTPARTYRITASHPSGTLTADLVITVTAPPPPTPPVPEAPPAPAPPAPAPPAPPPAPAPPVPAPPVPAPPPAPSPAPTGLAYPALAPEYPAGLTVVPVAPVPAGGAPTAYAVAPPLPAGLHLDPVTGVISGTPTLPGFGATYDVTASNASGAATVKLWLTVTPGLAYAEAASIYTVGVPAQGNGPAYPGSVAAAYGVTPALPPGLHLDPATGVIAGTPTAPAPMAVHRITAWNAGGVAQADLDIQVAATRQDVFHTPFHPAPVPGIRNDLDFPGLRRTRQYGILNLPQAPVLHAYHPLDPATARPGKLILQTGMNFKLPAAFYEALPGPVRLQLAAPPAVAPGRVDILCVVQDLVWNPGVPILFRPQYWTDPQAPDRGHYDAVHPDLELQVLEAEPGVHFHGHPGGGFFTPPGQSVHPAADPAGGAPHIVSSPDSPAVDGLDPMTSTSFWSLTRKGDRAAATLHLILDDADLFQFDLASLHAVDLDQLVADLDLALPALSPGGRRAVAQLKELARPIVTFAATAPAPAAPGSLDLTLTGSGFTGATRVTYGGAAGTNLRVVGDAMLIATIPALGPPGQAIVVTTPMGAGAPFNYP